ncbi:MAG: tRNA guanosine(34) transglycosylase Tgt [Chitinophagaceae bacterium]|nr:tRNA guanosine(34) transglycosylase Tgt [Chitinophagaceae bacterium]
MHTDMSLAFQITHKDSQSHARTGWLTTAHGTLRTPVFMPVGTGGSVKAITQQQLLNDLNAPILLGNTYHLYLRPGTEVLHKAGGLHRFMGWSRSILTDSGGYQVFSLSGTRKIQEDGVVFQSHRDGSRHFFTPEKVIDIQRIIGADIIMAFDECPPAGSDFDYARNSMERTHRWLDRCVKRFQETEDPYGYQQYLFPIAQGGVHKPLRKISCEYIVSKNLSGHAIGGLSVGEPEDVMYEICRYCCEHLPENKPRYLMGVGTPWNILECIGLGVDMFDCVMPTRNGRNAMLFTTSGIVNIDNKKWEFDYSPLDENLPFEVSQYYSKAYLRHLLKSGEITGLTLASLHNLSFYLWLVREAAAQIEAGTFMSWKQEMILRLKTRL